MACGLRRYGVTDSGQGYRNQSRVSNRLMRLSYRLSCNRVSNRMKRLSWRLRNRLKSFDRSVTA
ncbi:MAG: hypothetical protein P8X74_02790 [Reinekea sp.]